MSGPGSRFARLSFALRRLMLSLLTIIGGVIVGLSILLYVSQERMIFMPQPAPIAPPRAAELNIEEVKIEVEPGLLLRGWLARPAAASQRLPLAIYFGGNAEEVSGMVSLAGRFPGWALLAVNYRGYGGNPGAPSERALFADALAIYDWAARRGDVDAAHIATIGRSLGSGVAVYLAAERPLAAVVLIAPFDSLRAVAQRHYPYLPMHLLRHPFDSLARAPRIESPLLIVAAERDSIVPIEHARALYAAWHGPKTWREIAGADHNDLDADPAYWQAIASFLAGRGAPAKAE